MNTNIAPASSVVATCIIMGVTYTIPISTTNKENSRNNQPIFVYSSSNSSMIYNKVAYNRVVNNDGGRKMVLNDKKLKNFDKLQEISKLEYGWNGNDAEPFSDHLITAVRELIMFLEPQPSIFPTACESIQIEYHKDNGDYLEFEIYDIDNINLFKLISSEIQTSNFSDFDEIQREVNSFYEIK